MGEMLRLYIFLTLFLLHVILVHLRERRWHVRFWTKFSLMRVQIMAMGF